MVRPRLTTAKAILSLFYPLLAWSQPAVKKANVCIRCVRLHATDLCRVLLESTRIEGRNSTAYTM